MAFRDLGSKLEINHSYSAQVVSGSAGTVGATGVDNAGDLSVTHITNVGASGDTLSGSLYLTIKLQESDTLGSGYTDVAAADVDAYRGNTAEAAAVGGAIIIDDAAEDEVSLKHVYKGFKQFTRIAIVKTGTHTNGTPISSDALLETRFSPAL